MTYYTPKTLLEKIEDKVSKHGDKKLPLNDYIQTVAYYILEVIESNLEMEIQNSGYYENNGKYRLDFSRFGTGKVELRVLGDSNTGEVSLFWDEISLEGFIRKNFFVPHRSRVRFPTLEALLSRMKERIVFFTGEQVIIQAPSGVENTVKLYTKSYVFSFQVQIVEVPNTLLLNHAVVDFSMAERKMDSMLETKRGKDKRCKKTKSILSIANTPKKS